MHRLLKEKMKKEVRKDNIPVSQKITVLKFKLGGKDNKIRDIEYKLMAMEKRFSNREKRYNSLQS